ncbi:nucleolar protein 58-like isoform X1 [Astyanax mexicanus]|uniref:Nucleolar protein 58-like isoform X1 n=1 Tax=Astyanax mexicanus TaxID=7994 RepID=A0A8T2KRJ9_ASTMX|nr:nucleolar protein 58-like isoform X1 [Astyanax mexicanus]
MAAGLKTRARARLLATNEAEERRQESTVVQGASCYAPQPFKQDVLKWQSKVEHLENQIKDLKEDNAFLRKQLEDQQKKADEANRETGPSGEDSMTESDSGSESTSDSLTTSDFESSLESDSSSDEKKHRKWKHMKRDRDKKKKKKEKAKRKKKDKKKTKEKKTFSKEKVSSIKEVVRRYRKVLRCIQKGMKMAHAFKKVAVSRNAVKGMAAIAELYLTERPLLSGFKGQYKTLRGLAHLCATKIQGDDALAAKVVTMKREKKLIPFNVDKEY